MGFGAGFTGGVTLVVGLAYLSVLSHERNRQTQAALLSKQTETLRSFLNSKPSSPFHMRLEPAQQNRGSFTESFKARWNEEVENAALWVERKDWNKAREEVELTIRKFLGVGLQEELDEAQSLDRQAISKVQMTNRSRNPVINYPGEAKTESQTQADVIQPKASAEMKVDGEDVIKVASDIPYAKMADSRAQPPASMPSDIETALQERYLKNEVFSKSVEEVLENRYRPKDTSLSEGKEN